MVRAIDNLTVRQRAAILLGVLLVSLIGLLFVDPIPQDLDYHLFADTRRFFGIPNFNDVVSNSGFALVGALGFLAVARMIKQLLFVHIGDARPYLVFFVGVALVSVGSAYYHWAPSNDRLLWDRLPMSIAFMAFASAVVADRIHARIGNTWLLSVLTALGLFSLLYWDWTEQMGQGDLRYYAFVQFYPIMVMPLILWLFPDYRYISGPSILWVFAWYVLSKVFEHFDAQLFELLGYAISGHTLKHLTAAVGAFVVLRALSSRLFPNWRIRIGRGGRRVRES